MKKIIAILLIAGALYLGYEGVTKLQKSSKSFAIGSVELSAKNETGVQSAYIYIGFGVLLLIGGIITLRKS